MKLGLLLLIGGGLLIGSNIHAQNTPDSVELKRRTASELEIFKEKAGSDMEKKYDGWVSQYPPQRFPNDSLSYDYVRAGLARVYAREKNVVKAKYFIDQLNMEFWKGNGYGAIADQFYKNGDTADALVYYKRAVASAGLFIDGKRGHDNKAQFASEGYPGLCYLAAKLSYELKRNDEALEYAKKAAAGRQLKPEVYFLYARILVAQNNDKGAFEKIEDILKADKGSAEINAEHKRLYVKLHGSDKDYATYSESLQKTASMQLKARLTTEMLKETAANFTLTDVDGNTIDLAALKGKVVILDFWATWCGPCKRSFPAMQMAVNKYKADPNVKFLFIHTYERDDNATKDAKHYVDSMKYSFQVLMDKKDAEAKVNKVAASYKVEVIPAKFIIDRAGIVRFKLKGFEGTNEAAVNELSMMIELAKANS